jgi:hypothetical protein
VIKRFQIEDLIVQDASGVVFRALDTETGKTVAIRRFFPFGADGGGLQPDEQTAYNIAVGRLSGLNHPALRSVICGGCDPVDGMPFIATEWVEGESLQPLIEQGPLPPKVAAALITQALEVCELLSHVLAEEAVWVETDTQTIIIGSEASGRPFTFWLSPLKWLGGTEHARGLESIVTLTEEVMHWTGRAVTDQAGRGLGGWLKWLRATAATTTLQEARESLAASIGADPPAPAKRLATRAVRPAAKPIKRHRPKLLTFVNIALVLGLAGWLLSRQAAKNNPLKLPEILQRFSRKNPPPPPEASQLPDIAPAEPAPSQASIPETHLSEAERIARANQLAAEFSVSTTQADQAKQTTLEKQKTASEISGGVIQWDNHELLVGSDDKRVVVEGVIADFTQSTTGKTLYLLFSGNSDRNAARVGISTKDTSPDAITVKLKGFIGKKVHVTGTIDVRKISGLQRPDIMIDDVSAVQIAE